MTYAFTARPGFVSSWFTRLAQPATRRPPERERVAATPTSGIPASLRIPVVRRAARWARIPRSSPLQRSSARPRGPTASSASRSWRPRCAKPARSRPVSRCSRSTSTSSTARPARSTSMVIRSSHPKPGASGKAAARARALRRRWPERGSRATKPVRRRISSRATRFAIPKPPPLLRVNEATRRSAPPRARGAREPFRSASQRSREPGDAARSPAESASPFPRRPKRTTTAPASSARSTVASDESPSTTMILDCGKSRRRAAIVFAIRSASSRAATRMVGGSGPGRLSTGGRRDWLDRWGDAVGGRVLDAVVARLRALEQQCEREPTGQRVDVVDARDALLPEEREVGLRTGGLHADHRQAGALEPAHETLEEGLGRARSALLVGVARGVRLLPCLDDDRAVHRSGGRPGALLDQAARERGPERRACSLDQVAAQGLPERPEVIASLGVLREQLISLKRRVELLGIDRAVERHQADGAARVRVDEGTLHRRADAAVHRAEEEHCEPLFCEPVGHQGRIGVREELLRGLAATLDDVRPAPLLRELVAHRLDPVLHERVLGVPELPGNCGAEEDAYRQRDEDRGKRDQVVAEVEHLRAVFEP